MRRREFIGLVGGIASSPLVAFAQPATTPVVGFLNSQSARSREHMVAAFRRGLDSFGQDVAVEYYWADGNSERLASLSNEIVRRQVSVIVATGGFVSGLAVKAATTSIPIVVISGSDPVRVGLVRNFNRPGGNITGISFFITELEAKRVELLRELVPGAKSVAYLVNQNASTYKDGIASVQSAADLLGLRVQVMEAGNQSEIDRAFEQMPQRGIEAAIIHTNPFYVNRRTQIIALAARHRIPTIYPVREFASGGGLISYGTSQPDAYFQAGLYAARILKGENAGDLPVVRPTKFDLAINLRAAKALGLTVPPTLLARADEVIE